MNTKTMRLPPRRVLTPSGSTNNKRKERDDPFERPKPISTTTKILKPDKAWAGPEPITGTSKAALEPKQPSNQLLAGYLAHEFLTKGTLLGQPWAPPKGKSDDDEVVDDDAAVGEEGDPTAAPPCRKTEKERERYAEVAGLLKGGGTHLTGVVNPTQLSRFLHL